MKKKNWSIGKSGKAEANNKNLTTENQNLGENENSTQSVLGSENSLSDNKNEVLANDTSSETTEQNELGGETKINDTPNNLNNEVNQTQEAQGTQDVPKAQEGTNQAQEQNLGEMSQNMQPVDGVQNAIPQNIQPSDSVQNMKPQGEEFQSTQLVENIQNTESQNIQPIDGLQNTTPQNIQPSDSVQNMKPQGEEFQNIQPVDSVQNAEMQNVQPVDGVQNITPQNIQPIAGGVQGEMSQNMQQMESTQNVPPVEGVQNVEVQNIQPVEGEQNPMQPTMQTDSVLQGENSQGETAEVVEETEAPKKSKFNFPKKMGVVTGKTASISDITKLEEEATKSAKNKGKAEEVTQNTENENAVDDEIIDEEVIEEEVEEEVAEDQSEEEIVEEEVIEEEVLEEEVEDGEAGAVLNSEGEPSQDVIAESEGSLETQGEATETKVQTKIPEFTQTENISNISNSQTGVSEAFVEAEGDALKRIEEDEKRKSKFVMFPKKSDGRGAVNGEGFNKDNIKDGARSLRFREAPPEQTEADIKNEIKKPKPLWLKITIAVAILVVSVGAIFGAYLGYLQGGYDRVYDYKMLQVVGKNKSNTVSMNTKLDIITYNLSYGIMDPEFSYFKAETTMPNGSVKKGSSSRATNKDRVSININGSAELVGKGANSSTDFILFQDIDVDSTRSYYINQQEILADVLSNFAGVFAENGSSNYVFSPISSPLGKIDTRIATFSNKYMSLKIRHSLTSNTEFMEKYGANDNCIIVTKYRTSSGKDLSVINVNIGIYESEEVRTANLEEILRYMDYEANTLGNYVVVGGTFGYLLNGEDGEFLNTSGSPNWSECFPESFSTEALKKIGFRVVKDEVALDQNIGTVRDMSTEYNKGVSFEAVIDGFIVSKGVTVEDVSVIDNGFLYSSHNPVKMSFRLT